MMFMERGRRILRIQSSKLFYMASIKYLADAETSCMLEMCLP